MSNNPFSFIFYPIFKGESKKDLDNYCTSDKQASELEYKEKEEIFLVSGIRT